MSEKNILNRFTSLNNLRKTSCVIICILIAIVAGICFSVDKASITVSSGKNEPVYFGNRKAKKIAIMFNCYEGAETIPEIEKVLNSYNFHATFFFGGCFADDHPDLIKKLFEDGHEIGNHGFFHKKLSKLSYDTNLSEIKNTHDIIKSMTGIELKLFAPPAGDYSSTTLKACNELNYIMIMWSKDTIDWLDKTSKSVYNRATRDIRGGDFVLMHPFSHTLKALPDILDYYVREGYVVTTVSDCLSE